MRGYYKLQRGWMDHPVFKKEPYTEREAWLWLIEQAICEQSQTSVGGNVISLNRGQVSYSTRQLATIWKWSASRVSRRIKKWRDFGMIRLVTDADRTIISICDVRKYVEPSPITTSSPKSIREAK